ncbi:GmrSD restriction endonuclease domain-containing protein [Billgrantia ethanolica]|uniref:DUF262 domain-containing protein n=1 Tax=Billgrantia ethanolica TaxID=2733486 RepID=A0ABS9A559_9GAMM|nr:DUF262 domain-containing protein [Halomonas ethanolica]MCE8003964.1 DUF262 domain-containing protein [Halomonas ethanolica]
MATLSSEPTSVQSIYTWYREGRLYVNRRYQRKLVWTLEEKQKLIDSILRDYPIPAILLAEKEGHYEIIDGLQRLHAILSFIEVSYCTTNDKIFNLDFFPTAKSHYESGDFATNAEGELLDNKQCSAILDYTLAASIMRNAADEEVNDVFDRINTYGHRLSDQERRQSGIQSKFSDLVRDLACSYRGDVSRLTLPLYEMPAISIDLPMTRHGYDIKSSEVFWVAHGILRATDLRDSLDEQCIADIVACIAGQKLISRSKAALDALYEPSSPEYSRIHAALETYGVEKLTDELNYCIEQILTACEQPQQTKLRSLIFSTPTTNAFPSVFAVLLIAFHEIIVSEKKIVSDWACLRQALDNIYDRMRPGQGGSTPDLRRQNIDVVKGLISRSFTSDPKISEKVYADHKVTDIDADIRRSEVETSSYELKQGILPISEDSRDPGPMLQKIPTHICAIANNGKGIGGKIILGVCDKERDAQRAEKIYGITSRQVGQKHVVGIIREAIAMGISTEQYFQEIRECISKSELSEPLKSSVLSSIDYNTYYGLGIIVISIRPQNEMSYLGEDIFYRHGDETRKAKNFKEAGNIAKRFH